MVLFLFFKYCLVIRGQTSQTKLTLLLFIYMCSPLHPFIFCSFSLLSFPPSQHMWSPTAHINLSMWPPAQRHTHRNRNTNTLSQMDPGLNIWTQQLYEPSVALCWSTYTITPIQTSCMTPGQPVSVYMENLLGCHI